MQTNYDDTTRWDDTRKIYVDRHGYSLTTPRSLIVNAPAAADTTPNKVVFEPTAEGARLRVPGGPAQQVALAGPLVMNNNEIRLQGSTDSNFLRYNTTNSNVEIIGYNGTRILTGTNGSTNASQFDSNGLQSRKYARNSSAFSPLMGNFIPVPQYTRTLLHLGALTNTGVSGSAWTSSAIGSGTVLTAPFTGTLRVSGRVASFGPNTNPSYLFVRIYHPSADATFTDYDELATVTGGAYDLRFSFMGIFTINASERVGLVGLNDNASTKNIQIIDYHFEYIA